VRVIDILRLRLRSLFLRTQVEHELDEELRYHLERQVEENVAAGMRHEDARLAALRSVHGFEQRKEECRDMRGLNLVDNLLQDARFAMRQLRKSPAFASTAICTLALGMCASVAIFAFVDAALIKPLPYTNPSRLVGVYESVAMFPQSNLSYADYIDWKRLNNVFTSLAAYQTGGMTLSTPRGRGTCARRSSERRLLSHARYDADPRTRFSPRRGFAGRSPHRHAQSLGMAETVRRATRRPRAIGDAGRRAERDYRRPAAGVSFRSH